VEVLADPRDRGGGRGLVFGFAPRLARVPPGGIASFYVAVRALSDSPTPIEGMFTVQADGSTSIRVPWLITFRPQHEELLSRVRLSTAAFKPSDNAPAVLSFQAGQIAKGGQLEPVLLLELELRAANGARLGTLAQLRDLLPGRYAFGLTGRDAKGEELDPGRYALRLVAYPTGNGPPSRATVHVAIR
jgi:hypothetical protein